MVGGLGKSVMNATGLTPKRRVTAVADCVRILTGANRDAPLDHQGEMFSAHHYALPWSHETRPGIYVGANGPQMLKMAAKWADGIMMSDITTHHIAECQVHIEAGVGERTAPGTAPALSNFFAWHLKKNRAAGIREARRELVWRGVLQRWHISPFLAEQDVRLVEENFDLFLQAFLQQTHDIRGIPEPVIQALVEGLTFAGGLDDIPRVIDVMTAMKTAGLQEIVLKIHDDPAEAIDLISAYIVPALGAD